MKKLPDLAGSSLSLPGSGRDCRLYQTAATDHFPQVSGSRTSLSHREVCGSGTSDTGIAGATVATWWTDLAQSNRRRASSRCATAASTRVPPRWGTVGWPLDLRLVDLRKALCVRHQILLGKRSRRYLGKTRHRWHCPFSFSYPAQV